MNLSKILRTAIPLLLLALLSAPAQASERPAAFELVNTDLPDQSKLYLPLLLNPNPDPCAGAPVDVMMVIDRSGSMAGKPLSDEKVAAKGFVDRMNMAADQVGLVSFSDTATLDQPLTHDGTAVKNAIDALSAYVYTNITAAITAAQAELGSSWHNPSARKVILFMSDGKPEGTGDTASAALSAAQSAKNAGTTIFTIGLGSGVDASLLGQMASSIVSYYYAPTSEDLSAIYQSLAGAVCNPLSEVKYVINFHTQERLDVASNQSVVQTACAGKSNQNWTLNFRSDGTHWITNVSTGKCLLGSSEGVWVSDCGQMGFDLTSFGNYGDIAAKSTAMSHASPQLYGGTYFLIAGRGTGQCIDVSGWNHGDPGSIIFSQCRTYDNDNQLWGFR